MWVYNVALGTLIKVFWVMKTKVNILISVGLVLGGLLFLSLQGSESLRDDSGDETLDQSSLETLANQSTQQNNSRAIESLSTSSLRPDDLSENKPKPAQAMLEPGGSVPVIPPEFRDQLDSPPPQLPEDLRQQLAGPPPTLPADLQAQLDAPPPPLPDDIRRALQTPPRVVTEEEVNTPPNPDETP